MERFKMTDEDHDAIHIMLHREQFMTRLTEWEEKFLGDISGFEALSEKQKDKLFNICERVLT